MTTSNAMEEVRKANRKEAVFHELEWRRCATDPKYFITKYVYIQVQPKWDARGRTRFDLFDYQKNAIDTWLENRFTVTVKARQLGFTTLAMALVLWDVMFTPSANDIIVSKNQSSANKNLGMAKFMYQFLPEWMKQRGPTLTKNAEYRLEFTFPDGSVNRVKSFAGTETAGAGETATRVIADEFALMEDPSNTYRTLMPTTDAGGSMIIISTARGAFNEFAKLYKKAKRNENQFVPIFEPWTSSRYITVKEYESYRRQFAAKPWEFYSEYPSDDEEAFRESGNPRFTGLPSEGTEFEYVGHLVEDDNGVVTFEPDSEGPIKMTTTEPDPELRYYVGGDPAQGRGGDYSTAHVGSIQFDGKFRIEAMQTSNVIEPVEWAYQVSLLGRFFSAKYGSYGRYRRPRRSGTAASQRTTPQLGIPERVRVPAHRQRTLQQIRPPILLPNDR